MKQPFLIESDKAYHETMLAIYEWMNRGEENLAEDEINKLREMTTAAEQYENNVLQLKPVKKPGSITEVIELFMFENKLSQAKLADKLGIGKPKLSQILTGKRQPDVSFLKALYKKMNIDPGFILDHV